MTRSPSNDYSPSTPRATDLVDELTPAFAGTGVAFVSYLAAIPGLLPMVLLTALAAAILLIPLLVVSAAIGAVLGLLRLVARILSGGISVVTRARVGRDQAQPAPRRAAHQVARGDCY